MQTANRVLVVEDEPDVANLLGLLLSRAGYQVSFASNGDEGLAHLEAFGTDLLLLDVKMPGRDGWEVCRTVRERSDVPIVIVSACARPEDRLRGKRLGADDYVCKPFNGRELVARVQAACAAGSAASLVARGSSPGPAPAA